jgi:hypothetical protein
MGSVATSRKPLGIRATPEEQELISEAARREHRSINSFVLRAALEAAKAGTPTAFRPRTPDDVDAALRHAQALMRPFHQPGPSLADELIAERRAEAARD